jgi:hypothetical protein
LPPEERRIVNTCESRGGGGNLPPEASTKEIIPLSVVSIINADVGIEGGRRVVCVETFDIVFSTELWVACREDSELGDEEGVRPDDPRPA